MKKFRFVIALAALVGLSFGAKSFALDEAGEFILNNAGSAAAQVQLGSELKKAGTVVATWDLSPNSGLGLSTVPLNLKVALPKKSVITKSYLRVLTPLLYSSVAGQTTSTIAFHCEDANNIKTATDLRSSSAGDFVAGASDGAVANFKSGIAADCNITATVAGNNATTGKINVFVEYITTD